MASIEELRAVRLTKLNRLESLGISCFPVSTHRTHEITALKANFEQAVEQAAELAVCGRVLSIRGQGAIMFMDLYDGTATVQVVWKQDEPPTYRILDVATQAAFTDKDIAANAFALAQETIDIGDFIEIAGIPFVTKRGEQSVGVSSWRMLSKALLPLPEKWHGLQDPDERFRKRYLDVLMNEGVKDRFMIRSKLVSLIRRFYDDHGYVEVEAPILHTLAGGATAKPFVTHHNALDTQYNLTIAQELYLKKLLAAGFTKVYEMGRRFRNEGIDTTHNPEFTMLESNEAYADALSQRAFIQDLVRYLVRQIYGADTFTYQGAEISIANDFAVIPYLDLIAQHIGVSNIHTLTRDELITIAHKHKVSVLPSDAEDKIIDNIYKKAIRPSIIQPTFLIDYPVAFNPFAKRKEDDATLIDRFQLLMCGAEVTNCFSELNNPIDQRLRYEEQDRLKRQGEGDISPSDIDYLEAMEYGMPPNGGIGIGIDRLAMIFMDVTSIRESILFPTLRPKGAE